MLDRSLPNRSSSNMKKLCLFCGIGVVSAFLTACQTRPQFDDRSAFGKATGFAGVSVTNTVSPTLLQSGGDLFKLGPGDQIEAEMAGTNASRAMMTVGPDGKIYFNLLAGLDVWGLTLPQTKSLLETELAKYVKNEPQVTVTLRAVGSKYVWLLGRLNRPGIYPVTGPMTLLEAIALAGGTAQSASQVTTEELADLRHSFIVRQGQVLPADFYRLLRQGDMSQNIYLQPDDFVYVPSAQAREIYVLGAVRNPRAVALTEQATVVSAIAAASGTIKDAYLSHVAIVRGSLSSPQIAVVDYHAIVTGQAADVQLEPHDIVYVPFTPYRILTRYLEVIVGTFANTIAVNEGANAVRPGGGNLGIAVPVGGR